MIQVMKNLINSEKAVASGVLVVASSVMVFTGEITAHEWMEYTKTLLGIYVGGKTLQGAANVFAHRDGEKAKAQANEQQAKQELEGLKGKLESNDSAAETAMAQKFGIDEPQSERASTTNDDEPTDPGRKVPYAASAEG